ncbi:MAG: hypothetical protein K2J79_08845 [Ruminiclostridium sp.]|nr:hypothetical protein [Ruminiclostridium sp.]
MQTIYTNMDWKATPDYNPAKSTAGEPDENGIVKCREGTVARTDEVEINFCGNLPEEQAEKIRGYANAAKGTKLLAATASDIAATPSDITALSSESTSAITFKRIVLDAYDKTAVASDGSTFSVRYAYSKDGKECRNNYLSGMKGVAAGTAGTLEDAAYTINLKADITSYFSTASSRKADEHAIFQAYQSAMREIEKNMADGKADPTLGLKTTVTVNGTEWNFAELLNTVEKLNKSFEYFDYKGNLDYTDYAKMGISKSNVKAWAKENLSEDKQELVAKAVDAREETSILREKESLESFRDIWDKPGFVMPEEKAKYYETPVLSATNKEVRDEIKKLFEETDYNSPAAVSRTVNRFKDIFLPIMIAFGGFQGASGVVDNAANDIYKYIAGLFGGKAAGGLNFSV